MKYKTMISVCLILLVLIQLMCFLNACSEEPLWTTADVDSIDTSLYEPSGVCYTGLAYQSEFVDAPGMIFYRVQGIKTPDGNTLGARMAFINKATGTSHLFCFDPLCRHDTENCIAAVFDYVTGQTVYNAVSNMLYCIRPVVELAGGGSSVYKVDMRASGATLVWEGDRNEVRNIASTGKYVFWMHEKARGGRELCRLNVETDAVDIYPAEGKNISNFRVSGDSIYILFKDEIEYYLTDPEFSTTRKLEHLHTGIKWHYMSGHTVYRSVDELDENRYPDYVKGAYYCSSFTALDVLTGEERILLPEGDAYWISGMSDDALYYFAFSDVSKLYRLKTDGSGEKELIYTFDYDAMAPLPENYWPFNFCAIWEFHGKLYGMIEIRAGGDLYGFSQPHGVADTYFVLLNRDGEGKYTIQRVETYV